MSNNIRQQPAKRNNYNKMNTNRSVDSNDSNEDLAQLKASFLQFSSDFNAKKVKKQPKSQTNQAAPIPRDDLTKSFQQFQSKMASKIINKSEDSSSEASLEKPISKSQINSSRQFSEATESSGEEPADDPHHVLPKTFRPKQKVQLGHLYNTDSEEEEEEPQTRRPTATTARGRSPPRTIIRPPNDAEEEDHDDTHSDDGSIYEEPLPKDDDSRSPTRNETIRDLKKFHRTLSNQNLSLTVHPKVERKDSTSSSDTDDTASVGGGAAAAAKKPESIRSVKPSNDPKVPARSSLTAKHRTIELERQAEQMSKEDLISSLKAFQSQIGRKLSTSPTRSRTRPKRSSNTVPNRHKSVEIEAPPPAVDIKKSARRGSMMAMAPKVNSKRPLGGTQSDDEGDSTMTDRDIEDQNFRKWFESKMEARTGDNERFILEEDDHEHGEGVIEDKGHGPLVVNVLHSSSADESTHREEEDDSPHHSDASTDDSSRKRLVPEPAMQRFAAADRATQIKQKNSEMSRDEIKASLLQFQSQLNSTRPKPVASKRKTTIVPAAATESSEFRLPEAPTKSVQTRLSQIEKRNESLSRDQLKASLLAFKSNIEKKVPATTAAAQPVKAQAKPKAAAAPVVSKPLPDLKPPKNNNNEVVGDRNNIRRAANANSGRQDRIKMLEAEQATIPRDVMIASLQKFRADIQGKISSTDVSVDSGSGSAKKSSKKLENFDATGSTTTTTENVSMEVTEDDFLKVNKPAAASNKATDASREETLKNLLSFQSQIQGKIAKKTTVSAKPSSLSAAQSPSSVIEKETKEKKEDSVQPRKFESMLKNLEDLKKRNEAKVSKIQDLDRARKQNEEKVSAMISALSPEEATEMPTWFAEFAQQQENKFQELVQISEQRNKEIMRLSNDPARSQVRSLSPQVNVASNNNNFSQTPTSLEQHEKWQRNAPASSGLDRPGQQFIGYPPHEGTVDGKDAFVPIINAETRDVNVKCEEASFFIQRFAQETGLLNGKRLEERLGEIKSSIVQTGSYTHTYDELQYGCRLAWRNCGRFIMRTAYSSLTVRDCRQAKTAEDCFNQCVKHLKDVFDEGSESPVISVFQPKEDGKSAPVRIWNRELLGYAAYKRDDGSIMGDSSNLDFTALCVKFGWSPPEVKSDFDILPLLISDEKRGHENPKVFEIPAEAIHEVDFEHPDFDLFKNLNLRWYAQASDASMGIDIGGVLYQTAPFTRLYQATEISSFLLDRSRYGFASAIAAACAIRKTHLSLWRDDVQLQTQKSILNSFSREGLLCLDHHTVSEEFVQFYSSEVQDFGSCPADWENVVAPATSSMTGAYHQEMTNFLVKPQYLDQKPLWDDLDLTKPRPITIAAAPRGNSFVFRNEKCNYDHVFVYYASETGTSLRFATLLVGDFDGHATGPIPLDSLPDLLLESVEEQSLVIIVTSTASSGTPPLNAKNFLGRMSEVPKGSLHNIDFAVCAVCNSAYTESLASFAFVVEANLKRAGCVPAMGIHYVDTLEFAEQSFTDFRMKLFEEMEGILYKRDQEVEQTEPKKTELATMTFENLVPVLKQSTSDVEAEGGYPDSWDLNSNVLKPSLDLFRFKLEEEEGEESRLNGLGAGDHVTLYPQNMNDVVETVLRHVNTSDAEAAKVFLRESKDLSKPLSLDELTYLRDHVQGNERALGVLDGILTNISGDSSLSVEKLVQIMPPGSIPMKWILKYVPSMDPRFYSIASIDGTKKTVSIVQSVYTFEGSQKAGVASRWLRSLAKGQIVKATFTKTAFHIPQDDEGAPVVLISAGAGIAPCRTFWLSGRRNPTYLFCGCNSPEDLPFSTEIDLLKKKGLLYPFIAFSRGSTSKIELEGLLRQERATLLDLLYNSRTRLYVCGSPEVDSKVRNSLAMILAQGNTRHRGMGMVRAMDRLALMSQTKRYVREIYGNAIGDSRRSDPTYALWQESTVKVIRALAALEKLEVPVAPSSLRVNIRQKKRMNEEILAYNPMISGA